MIKCFECNKEYRKLTKAHFRKHGMTTEEYLTKYPDAKLNCEEYLKKASDASKKFFETLSKEDWEKRTYKRTDKHIQDMIERMGKARKEKWKEIYGEGSERNKKISKSKKEFWDNLTTEERSIINKKATQVQRERMGEEAFLKLLRKNGIKGFNSAIQNGKYKNASSFEIEMYEYINSKGYDYIPQFEINGWFYDCYIPELKLLFEFDGDFWHPRDITECQYPNQFKQLNIDKRKNNIAKNAGYNLVRIRLSKKEKIKELL